jgi:transposase
MPKKKDKKTVLPKPEEILLEIRKLLKISAIQTALDLIEKLNWTERQKAIWYLCSGKLTRQQLAQKSGTHLNTVNAFVEEAMTYGLLEEEKAKGGHPKRVIDYAPSEWRAFIKKEKVEKERTEQAVIKPNEKQG